MNSKKSLEYINFFEANRSEVQAEEIYSQRIKDAKDVYQKFSSTFENRNCPICGNSKTSPKDSFLGLYSVVQCKTCNSEYVNPVPGEDALSYYYNECICNEQFEELSRSRANKTNLIISERLLSVSKLIEELLSSHKVIRVLEIGCSSGAFLNQLSQYLQDRNLQNRVLLSGVDLDESAIANPVVRDVELHASSAQDFAKNSSNHFELILNFELIEHLHNPFEFMTAVKNILSPNGILYLHTPNANGMDNKALGYNDFRPLAHGIFPPMHLQAFTPENIVHFSIRCGLNVVDIETPGNFDVDMVKRFISRSSSADSTFHNIRFFDDSQLAIIQDWLRELNCSSHLQVVLSKD